MTEQIRRAKINKSNDRTNTQSEDKQVEWYLFCNSTFFYLRSVYLFCHSTCLSSLCVFVLSFDLFIFALCICSVIWLVYLRSVYLFCHLTCLSSFCVFVLSYRTKINKSNDRPNTQNEDKQVKLQNKYTERR
jgi:hypothetical protein